MTSHGIRPNAIFRIIADAQNPRCRRVYADSVQICKVYGWSENEAQQRAEMIVGGLKKLQESNA